MKTKRSVIFIALQTLIAGWDVLECNRVFTFLCDTTNLLQKTEAVIAAEPGILFFQSVGLKRFNRKDTVYSRAV